MISTVRRVEQVMGLPVSLALRGPRAGGGAADDAWATVVGELREVDRRFSPYRADSVVSQIDRGELDVADAARRCPALAEVLALAGRAGAESGGAFAVWLPTPNGRRRFDPSGVVKGWAVERAARHLDALADTEGTDYCLSAGGDLTVRVADPGRPAWRIGIEDPRDPSRLIATVPLRRGAVATSGAAHRGAHIVDPRTGAAPFGVASVTVITAGLTVADVDATAAYAQGLGAAAWLRGRPDRTALVVWSDGTTTTIT